MSSSEHGKTPFPGVSVVMPVLDMPVTLVRRAIRSVHGQDYPGAIDIVLWDDGTRDPYRRGAYAALGDGCDETDGAAGDRMVVTYRTQEKRGIARSRNDAVERAGAEWLFWLDGDDQLPPQAISVLVAAVHKSGHHYAIGQCRVVYRRGFRSQPGDEDSGTRFRTRSTFSSSVYRSWASWRSWRYGHSSSASRSGSSSDCAMHRIRT
jgi:glycosyltransferase involved in cell wall biosynthesis